MIVFVYNAHHYDMNYLLTYYFIDFLLYQLWKCRDIYMFLFFMTPMCLVGFQDPWNHYIWLNEETIIHMHDQNQPWSIYSVQRYKSVRCKSVKSFASSYHFNIFPITMQVTNLNQMCFFHRSDSIFISDAML